MIGEWIDKVICPVCQKNFYLFTRDFREKDIDTWEELTIRCDCGVKLWVNARVQFQVEAEV